jgi:hypothetical protein
VPAGFTLTAGNTIYWLPSVTNTSALTLAVNGLAATNVYKQGAAGPVACTGGEVVANQLAAATYDGTQFELLNSALIAQPGGFGTFTNLASASTTNLGSVVSHFVNITGTTTITSFGSGANVAQPIYFVQFAASLTLTYNAASLITPTGANIVTQAGDTALCQYLGSGNWQILSYQRANPTLMTVQTLTSASGTYTPGAGCTRARVTMCGGGGGQSGTGGTTTFGSWTAIGGTGNGGAGGTGGANGTGVLIARVPGQAGASSMGTLTSPYPYVAAPGGSPGLGLGIGGAGAAGSNGTAAVSNATGYGAGSAGSAKSTSGSATAGSSGGGAEAVSFWVLNPAATSYGVGGAGTGGNATGGVIIVEEFYN